MKSIERYLASIPSFNEEKKPFIEQIEEITERMESVESQIEELEAELNDLNGDKEAPEKEIERIEKRQYEAYVESLSDPKNVIVKRISESSLTGLKLDYSSSDNTVIVVAKLNLFIIKFSFPKSATTLEQYGPIYISLVPKQKTLPTQMKKAIKLLKQCGVLNGLKRTSGNSYLLPASLEKQPEIVLQRLSCLNSVAAELDSPASND